jgi:hypothetical protein
MAEISRRHRAGSPEAGKGDYFNRDSSWQVFAPRCQDQSPHLSQPETLSASKKATNIGAMARMRGSKMISVSDRQAVWSGRRESNPRMKLGKLPFYH